MGEKLGAVVHLDKAPLKYAGLSYTEIWITEVAGAHGPGGAAGELADALQALCASEDVEATVLGTFEATGRLQLHYHGEPGRRPRHALPARRPARRWCAQADVASAERAARIEPRLDTSAHAQPPKTPTTILLKILGVAQRLQQGMDHPPVRSRGAGRQRHQAAGRRRTTTARAMRRCVTPVLGSWAGLAIGCGINPRYGDLDPYAMAAAAIDEAVRNVVAVGADPARIALLDNFCWGNTDRPEVLGSLVRAAEACRDVALAFGTPFISGKDSLNNEFTSAGTATIVIPPTLLDPRPGPRARRAPVRDDGPEGAGQPPLPGRHHAGRTGRLALPPGHRPDRRRTCRSVDLAAGPADLRRAARGDHAAAWCAPATI